MTVPEEQRELGFAIPGPGELLASFKSAVAPNFSLPRSENAGADFFVLSTDDPIEGGMGYWPGP